MLAVQDHLQLIDDDQQPADRKPSAADPRLLGFRYRVERPSHGARRILGRFPGEGGKLLEALLRPVGQSREQAIVINDLL